MGRYYESTEAKCPYYNGEEAQRVYCDGPLPGTTLALRFKRSARDHKKRFCRGAWEDCPVARMITKQEEGQA